MNSEEMEWGFRMDDIINALFPNATPEELEEDFETLLPSYSYMND